MTRNRKFYRAIVCIAMSLPFATPKRARTAEAPEAARRAAMVAPFIDEQTLFVFALNWPADAPEGYADEFTKLATTLRMSEVASTRSALARLAKCGVREIYIIGSLTWLPEGSPLLVIPLAAGLKADEVMDVLREECEVAIFDESIIAGDAQAVESARRNAPVARAELVAAFEAVEGSVLQALFLPTSEQRDVVEAMLPRLPAETDVLPIKTVTRGCRWAALGFQLTPRPSLRLMVQSEDDASATAFLAIWAKFARFACGQPSVIDAMPDIDNPAALLTPLRRNDRLALELSVEGKGIAALAAALHAPAALARAAAHRTQSRQNLLSLGLALITYADQHDVFPATESRSRKGRPLLSWRVAILPLLGENDLYARFHLNEPWDSPHNRTLITAMPAIFRRPGAARKNSGRTPYVTPQGDGTALSANEPTPYAAFRDAMSDTILLVETAEEREVVWSQPADLNYDDDEPLRGLNNPRTLEFPVLFADGIVRFISRDIDSTVIRALFTRAGGERTNFDESTQTYIISP